MPLRLGRLQIRRGPLTLCRKIPKIVGSPHDGVVYAECVWQFAKMRTARFEPCELGMCNEQPGSRKEHVCGWPFE
jgi:hypothetical protein